MRSSGDAPSTTSTWTSTWHRSSGRTFDATSVGRSLQTSGRCGCTGRRTWPRPRFGPVTCARKSTAVKICWTSTATCTLGSVHSSVLSVRRTSPPSTRCPLT
uniref:(northern house mosquito) hypothetical protein n=1 Tax=Culex pipiens TaxID=7175 RepID=A0A8D8JZC8_CULPI